MKKRAFLISGLVMTATALFLKTVDISYTVYISNKIGAEGMGLYQLIVSVYCLFITVSTSGISLAVTRLTTEESAKGNENTARYAMRKCVALSMLLSVTAGSVLFCSAGLIGNQWLADSRTVLSLRVLAFALPFLAVSSCFNGYFLAKRRVAKSSAAQIFEQFAGMAATILVITLFMPDSLEYACCAIVIGSVASEVLSCLFVFVLYCFEKRRAGTDQPAKRGVFKRIFAIILPVSASSYLRNGLITLENTMIPAGLKKHGASTEGSLSVFGMLKGMVMPILFFPAAFLSSFTSLLIPEISEANAVKNKRRISSIASRAFQITLLFSIVMTSIYICFSDELGLAIYNSKDCGHLLKLLAPLVPLMYLDNVVDGMLKGLGEQLSTLRTNTIDSVIRHRPHLVADPNEGRGRVPDRFVFQQRPQFPSEHQPACKGVSNQIKRLLLDSAARALRGPLFPFGFPVLPADPAFSVPARLVHGHRTDRGYSAALRPAAAHHRLL